MEKVLTKIALELNQRNIPQRIMMKQGDAQSRTIEATLYSNGQLYNVTTTARIYVCRPDMEPFYNDVSGGIKNGVLTYTFSSDELAVAGIARGEIRIMESEEAKVLSSFPFILDIERSVYSDDALLSTNNGTVLQGYVQEAKNAKMSAAASAEAANTAALRAEQSADNAQSSAEAASSYFKQTSATEIEQVSMPMDKHENHLIYTLTVVPGIVYKAPDIAGVSIEGAVLHTDQPADEYGRYVLETVQSTVTFTVDSTVSGWGVYAYTTKTSLTIPNLVVDGNQLDDGTVTEEKLSVAVRTKLNTPGGLTEVNTGDIVDAAVTMPKLGEDVKAELSGIHVLTQRDGKWYDRQGVWYGLDESALTATIVGNEYTGANNGHVVLPVAVSANDQIYTVTRIVDMAFRSCLALKSLEICSRISSISMQAFGECSNLKSVSLPDSLTEIGNGAFYQCSIPSMTVPRGVTSIADYAFDGNAATLYIDNCEGEVNIGIWNGNQVYLRMKPNNYYTKTETDSRIEGNWRKITEMTLAEAAVVSVTADADGQPFSLKRFNITVTKPGVEGDTASGYLWLKSTFNNLPKPVVQSNTHSGTLGVKYRICGEMAAHWETDISSSGAQEPSDNTTAQVYRYPLGTRPEVYALGREPITNFILTWGYSDALPAGTSIEIWGMDA